MAKKQAEYKGFTLSPKYPELSKWIIDNPTMTHSEYVQKVGKRKAKKDTIFSPIRSRLVQRGLDSGNGNAGGSSKPFKSKLYELIGKTESLKKLNDPKAIYNFIKSEVLEPINKSQKSFKFEAVPEGFSDDVSLRLEMHNKS